MLDEADERWISEHGYLADNPLFGEIEHASDLLRDNPQLGILVPHGRFRYETRSLLLNSSWHLYYRFHSDRQVIEIVAIWYARRASVPPL